MSTQFKLPKELTLGDVVRLFNGPFGDGIVTKFTKEQVFVYRPHYRLCVNSVALMTEEITLHLSSDHKFEVLDNRHYGHCEEKIELEKKKKYKVWIESEGNIPILLHETGSINNATQRIEMFTNTAIEGTLPVGEEVEYQGVNLVIREA